MKHLNEFNKFYKSEIRLNPSRLKELRKRVTNIERFLRSDDVLGPRFIDVEIQGSCAHGTIVKPHARNSEFDADVLFYVKEHSGWRVRDYVEILYKRFRESPRYRTKVRRRTRCLVIDYKGEFHIDIVPVVERVHKRFFRSSLCHQYVTNRQTGHLEETNPQGFASEFNYFNEVTDGNLAKVVCLAKYFRDVKRTFSVKSILLTALLMNQVSARDKKYYADIPSTLRILFLRMNEFLKENEEMPHVFNPSLEDEDFIRHWDATKYANFREKIALYSQKIDAAYHEKSRYESMRLWQEILGDKFGYITERV